MNIKYRPDIDGLRLVAVLLVIFHHLDWGIFSGGYVGVDVFFVISGYLITKTIQPDIKNRRFSISDFYKRRIIRLAPAYFFVVFVVTLFAVQWMLPAELLNYFDSVLYSTFFMSNFYMWNEVGGYFGAQAESVPLLHLWSLAVEEQFYIVWPLALIVMHRLFKEKWLFGILFFTFLVALLFSEWGVQNYRAASYYLMPTRAFELLLGGILVYLPNLALARSALAGLRICGLAFILFSAVFYGRDMIFPGFAAMLPCLGAALIIATHNKGDILDKMLGTEPVVYLGKVSYPAYLWHWPIIAFLYYWHIEIGILISFLVVVLTFFASILTFEFIEKPARRLSFSSARSVFAKGFAAPALFFMSTWALAEYHSAWPSRFPESLNLKAAALTSYPQNIRGRCNEGAVENPLPADECILGRPEGPVDFLLVGDSHANHFTGFLDVLAEDAALRGYDITQSNTIYLPGVKRSYKMNDNVRDHQSFYERNEFIRKHLQEKNYKAVVLAGAFANHATYQYFEHTGTPNSLVFYEGMKRAIQTINASGAIPFVIAGAPSLHGVDYRCPLLSERFNSVDPQCNFDQRLHDDHFEAWLSVLGRLAREFPGLQIIKPDSVVCNDHICITQKDGVPLYRDSNHLNDIGSRQLAKIYLREYDNPLLVISDRNTAFNKQLDRE